MSTQRVIIGNSLEVLKGMEPESIDVCVTSPPYWGLRDYGSEPVVWGGNDDCDHEWGGGGEGMTADTCVRCGAWRGQLGLEPSPFDYIEHLCMVFDEVKRVLKPTGACWVNIGDTYSTVSGNSYCKDALSSDRLKESVKAGNELKKSLSDHGFRNKCLCQIPSRFAIAMTDRGWILRNECIWHKPNTMPVSTRDRFTIDFEKFFFFTKEPKYHFIQQLEPMKKPDAVSTWGKKKDGNTNHQYSQNIYDASKMEGRNKRTVWTIPTSGSHEAHCAMFPTALIETPIKACCPEGGIVLDPFCGSGTTLEYCRKHDTDAIGIEINPEYKSIIDRRCMKDIGKLEDFTDTSASAEDTCAGRDE